MMDTGKNVLLLVLAIVVGLVLAESAVRLLVPARNVGPSFTDYDAYYGKRLKPHFATTRYAPEFTMRFSTNSLGFRGPEPNGPPQGVVLFLGDSFTMGYGVSDGEEFPAVIRETLRDQGAAVPILNTGLGDNGNGRWVKFLRAEAAQYQPRLVVMQIHENDFADNVDERIFELTEAGELRELPVPSPPPTRRLQSVIEAVPGLQHLHLLGLLRQLRGVTRLIGWAAADPTKQAAADPYAIRLTLRLIEEALRTATGNGWPVVGVLVDLAPAQVDAIERLFAAFGADVVVFPRKNERPDLYYATDGHWRPAGHRLAASMLIEKVVPYADVNEASARADHQSVAARGQ